MRKLPRWLLLGAAGLTLCGQVPVCAEEVDIAGMISEMTLEQKIGQMLMPQFANFTEKEGEDPVNVTECIPQIQEAIEQYGFGGVILLGSNITGTEQTVRLTDGLQKAAMSEASVSKIPLLIAADQEGGYVRRISTGTSFCGNMALAATGNVENTRTAAKIMGQELKALGINLDFAPDSDVNNNPNNPVIGVRSFADDPDLVAQHVVGYLEGLQENGIISALKHFPGHGDTDTDSHTGLPCIDKSYEELKELELIPFAAGFENHADMVMTAHIVFPQIETGAYTSISTGEEITLPATLSETIISGILRGDMGFDGVVCTDALEMDAIRSHIDPMDAARLAINADVDILLEPVAANTPQALEEIASYIDGIADMVREGEIPEETIDRSVERILTLKAEKGLFEASDMSLEERIDYAKTIVGSKEHHDTEWDITRSAITMTENKEDLIPIQVEENETAAVFVPLQYEVKSVEYAELRMKEGGIIPESASVVPYCYQDMTVTDFEKEIEEADYILVGHALRSAEDLQDADGNPGWQGVFVRELLETAHQKDKKVVFLSLHLPYDSVLFEDADAALCCYLCSGMSEIPTEFEGETVTYVPNLPAAISAVFDGEEITGTLPVAVEE